MTWGCPSDYERININININTNCLAGCLPGNPTMTIHSSGRRVGTLTLQVPTLLPPARQPAPRANSAATTDRQFHFLVLSHRPVRPSASASASVRQYKQGYSTALRSSVALRPAPGPISAIWVSFRGTDDPNCYAASVPASHFKIPI